MKMMLSNYVASRCLKMDHIPNFLTSSLGKLKSFFDGHLQDQAHGKNVLLFCFLGGCYCYMGAKSIKLRYHFWGVLCQS